METLPNEMLELIVQRLKPQDIAHCSAVCRSWYETMNQDWIWEPYCDPELEEPLRTIPSVATPKFEIPETKTLSPICRWKLAYFREKHLWKNWRSEKIMDVKEPALLKVHHLRKKWGPEKTILNFGNNDSLCIDFFSDTQIVAWNNKKIEILDVSNTPAVVVAKTETIVDIETYYEFCVVETDLLLVRKFNSMQVYKVDISKRSITLVLNLDDISLSCLHIEQVKKNLYIFTNFRRKNLKILDLNNGKILKVESCPIKVIENEDIFVHVSSVVVSPNSDFVVVTFDVCNDLTSKTNTKAFVYCLKELKFLPGPEIEISVREDNGISLHDRWLAVLGLGNVTIFNVTESGEVLFSDEISLNRLTRTQIKVCNRMFVFMDLLEDDRDSHFLKLIVYSPASKTLTTIKRDFKKHYSFEVINNKFIAVFGIMGIISDSVWKPSSRTSECGEPLVEEWDLTVHYGWEINSSFTKEISEHEGSWYINHLW